MTSAPAQSYALSKRSKSNHLSFLECDIGHPASLPVFLSHQKKRCRVKKLPPMQKRCPICHRPFCDYNAQRWSILQTPNENVIQFGDTQPSPLVPKLTMKPTIPLHNSLPSLARSQTLSGTRLPELLEVEEPHHKLCTRDKCEFAINVTTKVCNHLIGHRCFEQRIISGATGCPICPAQWYKPQPGRRQALRENWWYSTSATLLGAGEICKESNIQGKSDRRRRRSSGKRNYLNETRIPAIW